MGKTTPEKPPQKPMLSEAAKILSTSGRISREDAKSLAGRVLSEGVKRK